MIVPPARGRRSPGSWGERLTGLAADARDRLGPGLGRLTGATRDRLGAWLEGLRPRRSRSLELELEDRTVVFRTLEEFEFALASRTEFPVGKVADLMERPPEALRRVAGHIRQVEKRFAQVLAESLDEPALVGELLREVEVKLFSQDHGWRGIIEALNLLGPEHDDYKRLALIKYMQYLGSRQEVLRSIYADKVQGGEPLPEADLAKLRAAHRQDTAIFDLGERARSRAHDRPFAPLPRGETVCLQSRRGSPVDLKLAGHPFSLQPGHPILLVDEAGTQHPLQPGKNLVGRTPEADVVIGSQWRAVSRRHLILEPVGEDRVLATDLSAHGTYVAEGHMSL